MFLALDDIMFTALKKYEYVINTVGLSSRPAIRFTVCIQNLNVCVYAFVDVATFLKLGRITTTLQWRRKMVSIGGARFYK